ncbi:PRC-barrel domain containing protein [Haladaptatus pallidirubidus]|uniref:PRC-barrel domain-containing protein n=1 Tax=Haladaptatus pallidirubidus TaxID=1008152 RepID=A0AAV3UF09_9EURY|nr:PRC-barrel domain containing protein [Haladaptatus pallidirubidus]
MRQLPTKDDEGKPVFNVDDQKVGIVTEVRDGTAYVDPNPSLVNQYKMLLGWKDDSKEIYPLPKDAIAEITEKELRLQIHDSEHETD